MASARAMRFLRMKIPENETQTNARRPLRSVKSKVQEKAGGPRGGKGVPVSQAMWAAAIGRKA